MSGLEKENELRKYLEISEIESEFNVYYDKYEQIYDRNSYPININISKLKPFKLNFNRIPKSMPHKLNC